MGIWGAVIVGVVGLASAGVEYYSSQQEHDIAEQQLAQALIYAEQQQQLEQQILDAETKRRDKQQKILIYAGIFIGFIILLLIMNQIV